MTKLLRKTIWVLLAWACWGCPARPGGLAAVDAGPAAEDAGLEGPGDAGAVDASVPTPRARAIEVQLTVLGVDGGRSILIASGDGGMLEIEPASALELRLSPRPKEPRVRLFDWTEQIVESNDTGPSDLDGPHYTYRLEPLEALHPGRSYVLSVDSEVGPRLLDSLGGPLEEVRLPLKILGELRADPAGKSGPARRKRRR